jgi:hypothetical protein
MPFRLDRVDLILDLVSALKRYSEKVYTEICKLIMKHSDNKIHLLDNSHAHDAYARRTKLNPS